MKLQNEFLSIVDRKEEGNGLVFTVKLNAEHFIFKSHFPGNPIMPGVCMLQAVAELLSFQTGKDMELSAANNVKYTSVLSPIDSPLVDFIFSPFTMTDDGCKVKVVIKNAEKIFAKTSLTYKYE